MTPAEYRELERLLRPQIRLLRRNMKIVVGEDDLFQEAIIRLFRSPGGQWDKKRAHLAAKHACVDQMRRERAEKRGQELPLGAGEDVPAGCSDEEFTAYLDEVLKHSSWEEAKAVRMRVAGYSVEEVARGIGRSVPTAMKLLEKVGNRVNSVTKVTN